MIRHRAGSGEPLVLVHGLGSYGGVWNPLLSALEAQRDVIVVDMPGFGSAPPGATTVPGLADAVERDLAEAGLEDTHFCGNSLGGWVSLELAKRGRARTVVALSPAGNWTQGRELLSRFQLLTSFWGAKAVARAGARPYKSSRARRAAQWTYRYRGELATPEEVAEGMRALAGSRGFMPVWRWTLKRNVEGLDLVRCPVLIAWGEHDRLLNKRQANGFIEQIDGAELKLLPGTGHLPMGDDPELVVETILSFQERVAAIRADAAAP